MTDPPTPGASLNALQNYIAQSRAFHGRVDALAQALASNEAHAIAARDTLIADLAQIVRRYESVIQA